MPFTLAHPAAVIPLYRRVRRFTALPALVIGSMVPDFDYVIPLGVDRSFSHSLWGLLFYCLPAGFAAYFVYHGLIKPVVLSLLPRQVLLRLPTSSGGTWYPDLPIWVVMLSILVGVTTHLAWDSFTHAGAFFVARLPILGASLFEIAGYPVYTYKLLQHGSTVLGLGLIVLWTRRWYRETPPAAATLNWQPPAPMYRLMLAAICLVPLAGGVLAGFGHAEGSTGIQVVQRFARSSVITAMSLGAVTLATFGLLWRLHQLRANGRRRRMLQRNP